jgi:hypothetical protein
MDKGKTDFNNNGHGKRNPDDDSNINNDASGYRNNDDGDLRDDENDGKRHNDLSKRQSRTKRDSERERDGNSSKKRGDAAGRNRCSQQERDFNFLAGRKFVFNI